MNKIVILLPVTKAIQQEILTLENDLYERAE